MKTHNLLYHKINRLATKLNNNIHPKHRIIQYYKFFKDNINENSNVLEIGCSIGVLAFELSKKASLVYAIDINKKSIEFAKKKFYRPNIKYIHANIMDFKFEEKFDFAILSNVLEHIEERIKLLERIRDNCNIVLVRVPMINRSWLPLYKKELGLEYRLDPTHYTEYTYNSFKTEIESAGLYIIDYSIQFGELWAKISSKLEE
ncbi:MAG: class I SAM-dependent methyltransferase [Promethearchaeota archaeon]